MVNRDQITVAAAIIFNSDDRFLIARKKKDLPNEGLWEFPGGKSEQGEDLLKTVERETMEELSMAILFHPECFCSYIYEQGDKELIIHFHFFIGWAGNPTMILTDHDSTAWINPDEYSKYKFVPGDLPAMELLANHYERACLISSGIRNRQKYH